LYKEIGIAAPAFLVTLRAVQGIAMRERQGQVFATAAHQVCCGWDLLIQVLSAQLCWCALPLPFPPALVAPAQVFAFQQLCLLKSCSASSNAPPCWHSRIR
jgi:hypothetical protein